MTIIELRESDVKHCKFCDGLIAWLKNNKGRYYPVNAECVVDGRPATFKTNFHRCQRQSKTEAA